MSTSLASVDHMPLLIASKRLLGGLFGLLLHIVENLICHIVDTGLTVLNAILPGSAIAEGQHGHKGLWPPYIAPLATDSRLVSYASAIAGVPVIQPLPVASLPRCENELIIRALRPGVPVQP